MKVLWLASIYPSALHPFDGDFIQRHARAVALFCEVELIHVVKDGEGKITNDVRETVLSNQQLTERIIYYKPIKTSIQIIDRFLSSLKYKKVYRKAVRNYIAENGKPAFVHLHMAMKAGLTALWLKRKYQVPYILTEHWGGYLDEAVPNIKDYNAVYNYYWNKIITSATICSFVSAAFQKQMLAKYNIKNSLVIPNVVNTDIFFPGEKVPDAITRFIHVSTMVYQKNTEAILTAFSLLKNAGAVQLDLYGQSNPGIEKLVNEFGISDRVFFKGEVTQEVLSKAMQQADALILYSRFETFGCVIIEANACGVPVIVSELEVFHELVEDGVNGVFVAGEDPAALAEKLQQFMLNKNSFNNASIAATAAERFNYKKIGLQFINLYKGLPETQG